MRTTGKIDRRQRLDYSVLAGERAKELRRNLTVGEAMLWSAVKGRAMRGYDFHRQKPIGDYIVDFFCPALMLAIEIDGDSHREKGAYDRERQAWLEGLGIGILRFEEMDVRRRIQEVLQRIGAWVDAEEAKQSSGG